MFGMVLDPGCFIIYFKIEPVDIALLFFIRKIEFGIAIFQLLIGKSSLIRFVSIGPYMKPDKEECIGRIINVFDRFKPCQGMLFIIQRNFDGVVNLLLPVLSGVERL